MNDISHLYIETCTSLRHYSTCILQVRALVVVQSIAVLSAGGYTLKLQNPLFFYLVVGFGIIFTLVLLWQQRNYLGDFETHLKQVTELERALETESAHGSWGKYEIRHKYLRGGSNLFRLMVESGPYAFFILCFVLLAILKVSGLFTGVEA